MIQQIRRKWYWPSQFEDRSSFRGVLSGYISGMCALFLLLGILASDYWNRVTYLGSAELANMGPFDYSVIGLFAGALALAIVLGFNIANHVFGPIYRLVQHMEMVEKTGNTTELKLREDDYFQEVVASYNKMLERIRQSETNLKS